MLLQLNQIRNVYPGMSVTQMHHVINAADCGLVELSEDERDLLDHMLKRYLDTLQESVEFIEGLMRAAK
jgi:hypothetical protein